MWIIVAGAAEPAAARVTITALDQDAATLIAGLSTLSGERHQPDVDLLVAGINATRVSLALVDATPDTCRQALAFALDCWWTRGDDGVITLLTADRLPRGRLEVRTLTSTLRRQAWLQPLGERLLAPWLGGQAGLSYLPSEGLWTATLDSDGHRRLVELLSLCERPQAQASSRIGDPAMPDVRRLMTAELSAHTWPALVDGLARTMQVAVALSPRLRLRAFPGVRLAQQSLGQAVDDLRTYDIAAWWSHGVLCLGERTLPPARIERQHPAARRRLALIPVAHLLRSALDGDLLVTALRRHVAPSWWSLPGAGIEFLPEHAALLVAGDVDAQHAVLAALSAIDSLGLDLGLQTIAAGAR